MIFDSGIAEWLRNGRVVDLAVAVTPVSDQIYNHVAMERVAIIDRKLCYAHDRIRILRIDMEDRNGQPLRDVRRESRGI